MRFDDPEYVREQYATEDGLAARASLYLYTGGGTDARDVVVSELRRIAPQRVLEVGCGWGELAERIEREIGCGIVALDLSPRMVELARERGVDAQVGDVQELPFEEGEFDAVVAAWMLYHVPDLERGLAEIARVVRPGGAFVAVTNGTRDFEELWQLVGRDTSDRQLTFRAENAEEHLRRYFSSVERHDIVTPVTFKDSETIRRYVGSSALDRQHVHRVPELDRPFIATKIVAVFVGEKAP
ncbi:MAG: class I SAM-dependent methyltransferase [Actinobacteria bacterium]|nr:class I SAM-dependent methyltransferase [Actinomycetota bacterium]